MTTPGASALHVYAPSGYTYRSIRQCRKCKRRTRHLVTLYVWHDPTEICLAHEPRTWVRRYWPDTHAEWQAASTRRDAIADVCVAAMAEIGAA